MSGTLLNNRVNDMLTQIKNSSLLLFGKTTIAQPQALKGFFRGVQRWIFEVVVKSIFSRRGNQGEIASTQNSKKIFFTKKKQETYQLLILGGQDLLAPLFRRPCVELYFCLSKGNGEFTYNRLYVIPAALIQTNVSTAAFSTRKRTSWPGKHNKHALFRIPRALIWTVGVNTALTLN